jgi:hypothetical protein
MACHYVEFGHTKPIVGALYVRWLRYNGEHDQHVLKSFNETTGMATLTGRHDPQFVLLSELSHWHMVKGPA